MARRSLHDDTRGVSTAVGYTLAIGITIVLVSGLMFTMSGLLDGQTDRATDVELETVAEGIATEVIKLDRGTDDDTVTAATRVDGPTDIVASVYTVSLAADCEGTAADTACLRVEADDRTRTVALEDVAVEDSSVTTSTIWLVVDDGTISLAEDRPA